jgi:LAO/AO transport system kinase
MQVDTLLDALRTGQTASLARIISMVENQRPGFEQLLAGVYPQLGRARRIGVTGPPGAGKSTLTQQLVRHWREAGRSVAVVAVDPTSPFSGGALLGDRIRMEEVSLDRGVYIRSMATRGSVGGLATSTREVCDVLDAAGFERILIETVGVGQSELAVGTMADSTVLVLVPESGDGIQALKSGVMEIADLYVVNKSDRPGAPNLAREIEATVAIRQGRAYRSMRGHHGAAMGSGESGMGKRAVATPHAPSPTPQQWTPPVLLTTATTGSGVAELAEAIDRHYGWMEEQGSLTARRRLRFAARTREVVDRAMQRYIWSETRSESLLRERLDEVVAGRLSPYELAEEIMAGLKDGARV